MNATEHLYPKKILYVALVRPRLDYGVQIWNPFLQKNLDILERIQNRATRVSVEIISLISENRLSLLGFSSLDEIFKRVYIIQAYKIVNEIEFIYYHG